MDQRHTEDKLLGTRLGPYQIQAKLGEGGMARVYKAYHERLRRDVALKVMVTRLADQAEFRLRFEREAQAIASLHHSNIVTVYDFFSDPDGFMCLVMQHVGGGTLRQLIGDERPLDPVRATSYALQMARALHHAHQNNIIHRDVKPQNMLISANDANHLLLSDFGIAKLYNSDREMFVQTQHSHAQAVGQGNSELTQANQLVGTADYMAPEHILGKAVDARVDVYALGIVLYQMLVGHTPFRSESSYGLLVQHVYTPPPSLRESHPEIPLSLVQIVETALQKDPEQRFLTAEAMALALEASATRSQTMASASVVSLPSVGVSPAVFNTPGITQVPVISATTNSPHPTLSQYPTFVNPVMPPLMHTAIREAASPAKKRRRASPLYIFAMVVIIILALLLIGQRVLPLMGVSQGGTSRTIPIATSFVEKFQDHTRNWPSSGSGMQANIADGHYLLESLDGNTHVVRPDIYRTGSLPKDFLLTEDIAPVKAASNVFYGLAFRIQAASDGTFSGYVFAIDGNGDVELAKFMAGQPPDILASGTDHTIKTGAQASNIVQVQVRDSTFSFKINAHNVKFTSTNTADMTTYHDATISNGQPGIFFSGTNTLFRVASVQLVVNP